MRISELSRHAGVPVSTIKFYIREGLLPPGERSHRNQASYGEAHLARLDLIKGLRDVCGLGIDVVRRVLEQVDRPWGQGDPIGEAVAAIHPVPERERTPEEQAAHEALCAEVEAMQRRLPWVVDDPSMHPVHRNVEALADAIGQLRRHLMPDFPLESVEAMARVSWLMSEAVFRGFEDVPPAPGEDLVSPTRSGLLGILLLEPIVTALLRTSLAMRSVHLSEGRALPHPHLADLGDDG